MVSYILSHQAYLKIFFHAAKHPHLRVNGVLLGKLDPASQNVLIEDVIPLLHHWTSLSAMMSIGLNLAQGYAESVNLALVGYYQASDRVDDTALAPVGEKVVSELREQFKEAIAFVIDGDKLGSGEPALIPYLPWASTSSWRPYNLNPPAFSIGSSISLANPASPSQAIALVRDAQRHYKFGDFDDHLEDVTIDWLRNQAYKRNYRKVPESASTLIMTITHAAAFNGTFIHSPRLGVVDILRDYLLAINHTVVDDRGLISHFSPANSCTSLQLLQESNIFPTIIPDGSFVLPTFCDLHLHAPQFLYQGTGLHLPLMQWLDEYGYRSEERIDADPLLARKVYKRLAQRLIEAGTGAVLLFGTIKKETNIILAEEMQNAGIRAFVGKLSMDISSRPSYVESSSEDSLASAQKFVAECRNLVSQFPPHRRLVEPVITPRFIPTCSNDLLSGLGALSEKESLRIQSHLAEAHEAVEWVKQERGIEDFDAFESSKLHTNRTIQAHCTFLNQTALSGLAKRGTAVAHCPLSNSYFSERQFPLREALSEGVKIGLGSDIAGGYSVDIMDSMRKAVITSRLREGARKLDPNSLLINDTSDKPMQTSLAIDWVEALHLATRGGAHALGLPQTGVFEVGAAFDAQYIKLYDDTTGAGVGALDFFDSPLGSGITLQILEKWWCIGDVRNRTGVWIQGEKLT
ncbi:Metallo-dependent hydrolase [Hygrophoropsis aurantiaca]|uniref:Metallo-dependent hydrolase n=1 Tax=Hygrophoropsis aurantiaca TaxID=72124 RepID=A0ACB8A6I7_9AGAM|nr:Metallo-dependent hydrolase [Hygrophoropsis aurantiaca]